MLILYGNMILIILAHYIVGPRERDRGFSLRISVLFRMTRIIDPLALSCHFVPRSFNRVAEYYSKLYIAALIYLAVRGRRDIVRGILKHYSSASLFF